MDFTQMAMAAASLLALVLVCPGRSFRVFFTDLIQRQNRLAWVSFISVFHKEKEFFQVDTLEDGSCSLNTIWN